MGIDEWYEEGDESETFRSAFIGLTNNHRYCIYAFGYGLSYSNNYYNYYLFGPPGEDYKKTIDYSPQAIGLMLTGYFFIGKSFELGVIYRPNLYNIDRKKFHYEHLISIDFAWKIPLKNKTTYIKKHKF